MNTKVVGITFASTMLFATITSGLLLSSSTTHAADDSAVTVTEITVPSSCSMTANVSTPHIADIVNGNRAINIGKTTLSTFCNDPGGFAIYAIGYTNNELGATNVIATNNTDTIATGNTAPSNNSSWGMKVVNNSTSSFPATITPYFNVATNDGYVAVPNTFTLMASRNSGTAMDSATLLDTTYGAYISPTQPVGEYNGQVLYTMVHPSSAAGPNAETMFEAAFLMQPTPPAKKTVGSNSYYKMQDMTPDICTVMSIGAEGQMVDDRDDKIYWVLKAKDGKCWMTQNLDHDIVTTANYYTPQNTDVDTNWTAERATIPSTSITSAGAFTGWTNDNSDPYSADPGDWYFTDTYYIDACNSDPWCRFTNPSADATTLSKFSTTPYAGNGAHGHVGNYYNWTAAIASNDSSSYTTSTFDDVSKSPQTSICPAGWRLPTISSTSYNDDFTTLLNAYNAYVTSGDTRDQTMLAAPLYFVRSGVINNGILYYGGQSGTYWSNTALSSTYAYYLGYNHDTINLHDNYARFNGYNIRCVARTGTEPVSVNKAFNDAGKTTVNISGTNYYKMQDMNSEISESIALGQEGKLVDVRDNKIYNIAKLCVNYSGDNCTETQIWMTQNLDLIIGSQGVGSLTNQTSDINTDLGSTMGYSTSGSVITWTPSTTLSTPAQITNHAAGTPSNSLSGWTNSSTVPYQGEGDDYYVFTSGDTNADTIYSSLTACINGGHTAELCSHYHVGNYYNWSAAVASNNTDTTQFNTDLYVAPNSICPKGWRLPNGLTQSGSTTNISEFNKMALANGVTNGTTIAHSDSDRWVNTGWGTNGFNNFRSAFTNSHGDYAPMYFVQSGFLSGSMLYRYSAGGFLWSSTARSASWGYYLDFFSGAFNPAGQDNRHNGFGVRCIAR